MKKSPSEAQRVDFLQLRLHVENVKMDCAYALKEDKRIRQYLQCVLVAASSPMLQLRRGIEIIIRYFLQSSSSSSSRMTVD